MGIATHPSILILGLLIFNMGTGYNAAMRSISIHVVGGQASPDIGRLFAVVAIVESIGVMVAGPGLAQVFEWGIDMGEPWIGVPYIVSAGVFAIVAVITFVISVKDKEKVIEYSEVETDEVDWDEDARRRQHLD